MKPFFIKSIAGNIFCLYHSPAVNVEFKRNILFIPPFAEELNRSRHMINKQAREFSEAGYGVLILDLYGTGDSEGDLGEASLAIWQKDILAAVSWLRSISDTSPIIWAMRTGGLIATDLLQKNSTLSDQMILWSPVIEGKQFMTQFLRIKTSANLTNESEDGKTSVKDLWENIDAGKSIEIAGYNLSAQMATDISALSLKAVKLPRNLSVKWVEISQAEPACLSPAIKKIVDTWKANDINITAAAVNDLPFYNLQEPVWANNYIKETLIL